MPPPQVLAQKHLTSEKNPPKSLESHLRPALSKKNKAKIFFFTSFLFVSTLCKRGGK